MKLGKKAVVIAVLVIGVIFLLQKDQSDTDLKTSIKSIDSIEFSELAKDPESFLLDVHIPEQSHIPGTDAFIPYNEIEKNLNRLPRDKDARILVYCRSGSMSREAARTLQGLGYKNVVDLAGGINAYREVNVDVTIDPARVDFGTVIYGDVPTTEFTLTNFTPQKLEITRASTSCTCTSAEIEKTSLEPYEDVKVKVSFNPAVHKDDTDLGELIRTIYIETDNPNFKQVTAEITANVIKKRGD